MVKRKLSSILSDVKTEKEKKKCFKQRSGGILKKAKELSVLCGADVGVVIYGPSETDSPFVWPENKDALYNVICKYYNSSSESRRKYAKSVTDYIKKDENNNISHVGVGVEYNVGADQFDNMGFDELKGLYGCLDAKLSEVNARIDMLKRDYLVEFDHWQKHEVGLGYYHGQEGQDMNLAVFDQQHGESLGCFNHGQGQEMMILGGSLSVEEEEMFNLVEFENRQRDQGFGQNHGQGQEMVLGNSFGVYVGVTEDEEKMVNLVKFDDQQHEEGFGHCGGQGQEMSMGNYSVSGVEEEQQLDLVKFGQQYDEGYGSHHGQEVILGDCLAVDEEQKLNLIKFDQQPDESLGNFDEQGQEMMGNCVGVCDDYVDLSFLRFDADEVKLLDNYFSGSALQCY